MARCAPLPDSTALHAPGFGWWHRVPHPASHYIESMPSIHLPARPFHACAIVLVLVLAGCDAGPRADSAVSEVLRSVRPETRGLDSLLLVRAYEHAATLPRLHSLLVSRHGELIAEEYFRGRGRDRPANIKSAS